LRHDAQISLIAALIAGIACGLSFAGPVQAGTRQPVRAKGVGKTIAIATTYAQADLKQTAKALKGKVTQASTNCGAVPDGYRCKISAVVCPIDSFGSLLLTWSTRGLQIMGI
jgi:hypothetical protein